jgi:hypothetical protein
MKSTINAVRVVQNLSPITREFFDRIQKLEAEPISNEQKIKIRAQMSAVLTPEQRAIVEREALAAAIELQHSVTTRGNRAERRKVKKNLRAANKRGEA